MAADHIQQLTDHLFRREAGKMVSVLTKIFGAAYLELAEDVVQDTLLHAIQVWKEQGIPDNPPAWLFRVAKNKAIDIIRRNKHSIPFDFSEQERVLLTSNYTMTATMDAFWEEPAIRDDMLGMMFACCHPGISEEQQVTIILKTLCGLSTAEIAKAFLSNEDTISKRLYRTKNFFREHHIKPAIPAAKELLTRTGTVLNAIYLLFNEGYNSTHSVELIRVDLMEEAMLLCRLLTEHGPTQLPETYALMALMCFHRSRTDSRLTTSGEIILLPDQDRQRWDREMIALGNNYMNLAATGNVVTRYHLIAAIAYEHCTAGSYETTNWQLILQYYDLLSISNPGPITTLNKAVVVMQVSGAAAALTFLETSGAGQQLSHFYLYHSLLGELYSRLGCKEPARVSFELALQQTQSETERRLLRYKLQLL